MIASDLWALSKLAAWVAPSPHHHLTRYQPLVCMSSKPETVRIIVASKIRINFEQKNTNRRPTDDNKIVTH